MNLDLLAGILCGIMAISALIVHAFTSPDKYRWMPLPEYVRFGLVAAGFSLMWRSVDFISIAASPATDIGHINGKGLVASVAMTYLLGSMAVYVVRSSLPAHTWGRLKWLEQFARTHKGAAPSRAEIVQAVRQRGIPAVAPGEGPEAVVREGAPR